MATVATHNYFSDLADAVQKNGYHIIPVQARSKHPATESDWRTYCWSKPEAHVLKKWRETPTEQGLGLACGRASVAIDIDADDAAIAASIERIAFELFGETPLIRQGQTPRLALIYRPSEPILSRRIRSVDTIGLGAQLVAYGLHPKSGLAYRWANGNCPSTVPASNLPAISNEMIEVLYRKLAKDVFKCDAAKGRLRFDRVNYTPPLSSIGVMANLLFRSFVLGPENAHESAIRILAEKYGDTGTGLGIDMLSHNKDLDF